MASIPGKCRIGKIFFKLMSPVVNSQVVVLIGETPGAGGYFCPAMILTV